MNLFFPPFIVSWFVIILVFLNKFFHKKQNNKEMLGISVIIPTHNNEKTICECVNSVIKSGYHNLEIIVVNDGSTDNTVHRLYQFKDKIKIINQPHIGKSAALNNGFRHSNNPIIFILDGDTFVDKNCFYNVVSKFDKKTGAVTCKYIVANKNGILPQLENIGLIFESIPLRFQNIFKSVFEIRGCGTAISRQAFESVNGFDLEFLLCEDTDFGLKLLERGWKMKYEPLAVVKTTAPTNFMKWFKRRVDGGIAAINVITSHWKAFLTRPYLLLSFTNYVFLLVIFFSLIFTFFNSNTISFLTTLIKSIHDFYLFSTFLLVEFVTTLSSFYSYILSAPFLFLLLYFYLVSRIENENFLSLKMIPYIIFYSPALFVSLTIGYIIGTVKLLIDFPHKLPYKF